LDLSFFLPPSASTWRWRFPSPCEEESAVAGGVEGFPLGGLLLVQITGLGASVSYGALLSLVIASLPLLARLPARRRKWILGAVAGLAAAGGGAFLLLRGAEGASPLILRARNWWAAWEIFLGERLLGVGFGGFADAYAGRMAAGMNETAFAHNSYLQVAAEGGVLAALWVVLGAILLLVRVHRRTGSQGEGSGEMLLALPVSAFLVHNLFDFSAYLPSLSIAFAALAGIAVARDRGAPAEAGTWPRGILVPRWALLLLLLGGAAWGVREAQTRTSLEKGKAMLDEGKIEEAITLLRRAEARDPSHPDPPALLAEIHLHPGPGRPGALTEGESHARRAVELRPRRAYGHYILALYRLSNGDRGEAWVEISRARELFPSRELYVQEESRLRDLIASEEVAGKEPDATR